METDMAYLLRKIAIIGLIAVNSPVHSGKPADAALPQAMWQAAETVRTETRTVAGNLDTEYINRLHHVSPMPASRNPIDVARRIAGIAQIHFSSAQDTIVPPEVARRFAAAAGGSCVTTVTVRGVAHDGDWAQDWRELLAQVPVCRDR